MPIRGSTVEPTNGGRKVHVQNPSGGGGGTGLTDAELRASPVATALDSTTLAALETVNVGNLPAVQPVSDSGGALTVDDGGLSITVDGSVGVSNFPAVQAVNDNGASLSVDDGGSSLTVDGTVGISGTVPVSGTFWQATQPVSGPLTDAQLRASAVPTKEAPAAMAWVSAKSVAPAANSVQVDTGALAAGDYDFDINLAAADTLAVGKGLVVEHRNAANGATLFNLGGCVAGQPMRLQFRRYTIVTNERIRVIAGTAAGAASSMYISAIGRRLS